MHKFTDQPSWCEKLQVALIEKGYDVGPDGADNKWGPETAKALLAFRKANGLSPAAVIDNKVLGKLGLESYMDNPASSNWFSMLVGSTFGQYLIAMLATFIAVKLGVDKGTVQGILVQIIGIIPAIIGMAAAAKSKIVVNGTVVPLKAMPAHDVATVAAVAAKNK